MVSGVEGRRYVEELMAVVHRRSCSRRKSERLGYWDWRLGRIVVVGGGAF